MTRWLLVGGLVGIYLALYLAAALHEGARRHRRVMAIVAMRHLPQDEAVRLVAAQPGVTPYLRSWPWDWSVSTPHLTRSPVER